MIDTDTCIYYGSLLACAVLARQYKKLESAEVRRHYSTGIGVLVIALITWRYIYHNILMVWVNVVIITCCDKRYLNKLSLGYTLMHLTYIYHTLPLNRYMVNVYQIMALRLMGLAGEIYRCENTYPQVKAQLREIIDEDLDPLEVIGYSCCFVGLHKGPYYRRQVYQDHINSGYNESGSCWAVTRRKLAKACACAAALAVLRHNWPVSMYARSSFYQAHGSDYRFLYNVPQLVSILLLEQLDMSLCTAVCTEAGLGLYPVRSGAIPGHGPLYKIESSIDNAANDSNDTDRDQQRLFSFSMLQNCNRKDFILGPLMKDTVRSWNLSYRYWFWVNTYKNVIHNNNRDVRTIFAFTLWAIWRGLSISQGMITLTLCLYMQLENEYKVLIGSTYTRETSAAWDTAFSIMRLLCLVYITPCFVIDSSSVVFMYYNSIYWSYHVIMLVFLIMAAAAHVKSV